VRERQDSAPRDSAPRARSPGPARVVLVAGAVNSLGVGLVLPFTLVYVHKVLRMSLPDAGTVLAVGGVAGLVCGPAWGSAIDRWGPRSVLVTGSAGQAVALAGFATAHSRPTAVASWIAAGAFQASNYPSLSTLLAVLADGEARARLFGHNYVISNVAVGVGGLLAGWLIGVGPEETCRTLYWLDALGFAAVLGAALLLVPDVRRPPSEAGGVGGAADGGTGSYAEAVRHRGFRLVFVVSLLLTLIGHAALEYGVPALVAGGCAVPADRLAWVFAANTAALVVLQPLLTRAGRISRGRALRMTAASWLAAGAVMVLVVEAGARGAVALDLLLGVGVLIAVGEVLMSPALAPLVNDLAPAHLRGRFNVATSVAFGLAYVAAPVLFTRLLTGHHRSLLYLAFATASTAVVCQLTRRLEAEPAIPSPRRAPEGGPAEEPEEA
jgi:MFS family permease